MQRVWDDLTARPKGYLHAFDGLRVLAMTGIIAGHTLGPVHIPLTIDQLLGPYAELLANPLMASILGLCFSAVDVFFVLSGFLFAQKLLNYMRRNAVAAAKKSADRNPNHPEHAPLTTHDVLSILARRQVRLVPIALAVQLLSRFVLGNDEACLAPLELLSFGDPSDTLTRCAPLTWSTTVDMDTWALVLAAALLFSVSSRRGLLRIVFALVAVWVAARVVYLNLRGHPVPPEPTTLAYDLYDADRLHAIEGILDMKFGVDPDSAWAATRNANSKGTHELYFRFSVRFGALALGIGAAVLGDMPSPRRWVQANMGWLGPLAVGLFASSVALPISDTTIGLEWRHHVWGATAALLVLVLSLSNPFSGDAAGADNKTRTSTPPSTVMRLAHNFLGHWAWRPLSTLSYGIYLMHMPAAAGLGMSMFRQMPDGIPTAMSFIGVTALAEGATAILALIVRWLFEKPVGMILGSVLTAVGL